MGRLNQCPQMSYSDAAEPRRVSFCQPQAGGYQPAAPAPQDTEYYKPPKDKKDKKAKKEKKQKPPKEKKEKKEKKQKDPKQKKDKKGKSRDIGFDSDSDDSDSEED